MSKWHKCPPVPFPSPPFCVCSCGGPSGVFGMHCLRSPMFFSYSCSACWSFLSWLLNCLGKGNRKYSIIHLYLWTFPVISFVSIEKKCIIIFFFYLRGLLTIDGSPYFTDYLDIVFDLYVLVTTANSPDVM